MCQISSVRLSLHQTDTRFYGKVNPALCTYHQLLLPGKVDHVTAGLEYKAVQCGKLAVAFSLHAVATFALYGASIIE